MPPVSLAFVPPDDPDVVKLYILESADPAGPFLPIETVTSIGTYPDFITEYTTSVAASVDDWFTIQWEDSKGAKSDMSTPIQGGHINLIGEVVRRVQQRDRTLDIHIIQQEAEAAIQRYLYADPYSVYTQGDFTYSQLNGIVYMVLARSYIVRSIQRSSVTSATIGLVSMKAGETNTSIDSIEALIDMANDLLGISYSLVMLLEDIQIGASFSNTWRDQSRLVLETEIL